MVKNHPGRGLPGWVQSQRLDDEAALASAKRLSLASGSLPSEHGMSEALAFKYWDSDWSASLQTSVRHMMRLPLSGHP